MNSSYILNYKNIILRPLCDTDLEILRKIRNDSNVSRYLRKISYINEEQQQKWFQRVLAEEKEIIFAIEEKEKLCRCVGSCSLYQIEDGEALFGKIAVDPCARGLHAGTNAIICALHFGFSFLNLNAIDLLVNKENRIAKGVYSGIGFETAGDEDGVQDRMRILPQPFYQKNDIRNDIIISGTEK
jgi:RimJ/RimL family protein N-acetyltransferase